METPVNLWVRADLETFNSDTLALIPQGQQQEYITVMKELAHARAMAALVLEQMFQKEQNRAAFFEPFILPSEGNYPDNNTKAPEGADVLAGAAVESTPDYNTKAPEGAVCGLISTPAETDTPDYTPDDTGYPDNVIDFAKYLAERHE